MKLWFWIILLLIGVSIWAQPQSADETASAQDLLQRVAEVYHDLESFAWTAVATITTDSGDFQPSRLVVQGEFRRPHQMRIELKGQPPPLVEIEITDGRSVSLYYPSRHAFCRPDPKLFFQKTTPYNSVLGFGRSIRYEDIRYGLTSARIVGNRELKIGAESVNCRAVAATYQPAKSGWSETVNTGPIMYWIDPKTNIVVQESYRTTILVPGRERPRTDTRTTTLVRYRLNSKLQDARFRFQPPQGVTEQSCFSLSSGS